MFAHGPDDIRKAVIDITEGEPEGVIGSSFGENSTEKEASTLHPKWSGMCCGCCARLELLVNSLWLLQVKYPRVC